MLRWPVALVCLLIGGLLGGLVAGSWLHGQQATPLAVPKEMTSYREVVKQVLPAVVSIEGKAKPAAKTKQQTPKRRPRSDDPRIPDELRKFFEESQNSPFETPDDAPMLGFGSGFLVDPKGIVLTNYHVVDGAEQVEVTLQNGRKFVSKDIKTDPKTDLAIVRIEAKEPLPYLELGNSDGMEIGDRVLAVGAPFGLTGSVTSGIISAKGRNLAMNMYEDFLQTDAAINPGNSGGPLVSLDGRVIGINSAIKSRTGGFQGVGMAISSNMARTIMQQLQKEGVVHRGYLGIQMAPELSPDIAARLGVDGKGGVLVSHTLDNSPASKAGIQDGDVITSINGKPIKDDGELKKVVAGLPLGKPVELNVVRDGKAKTLQVTIEEQPRELGTVASRTPRFARRNTQQETLNLDKFGMELADVTPEMAEQLGFKGKMSGAIVTQVEANSPAADAGLRRGMVIAKVDKKTVTSAEGVKEALDKASSKEDVLLQVQTAQGGTDFKLLKVGVEK